MDKDDKEDQDPGMTAKNFLLSSACRSLDEAFQGHSGVLPGILMRPRWRLFFDDCFPRGANEDKKKPKAKDMKDQDSKKKKKKKAKKKSSSSACNAWDCSLWFSYCEFVLPNDLHDQAGFTVPRGPGSDSTDTKSDEQTTEPEEAAREDAFLVLGLLKKDYPRPIHISTLDGLATRQLAYTIPGITDQMMASDVLECGGNIVTWLQFMLLNQPSYTATIGGAF